MQSTKNINCRRTYPLGEPALCYFALVGLVLASYWPAMLYGGFVWDDVNHIPGEPALTNWDGLKRIWFSPAEVQEPHYRPLTYTTFWLEHKLWGFEPRGYHVVNVLLHAANVLLLWRILCTLAVPGAWLIAAVFAVHPLHVESVAWTIERKDVLSGLFYLACVLTWLRFVESPATDATIATRRIISWRYWLALALLAAGMLAKNMVVTLPAALLILHWWRSGRVTLLDVALLMPFFLVALGLVAVDLWQVTTATPAPSSYHPVAVERFLIAARAVWFYVGKLAWPADLAVIYPRWDINDRDVAGWVALVAAVALTATLWFLRNRIGRGPLAGALFYAVTLSPTLGFVDHTYMGFSFVADRYQYLAGIGVLAVLIGAAQQLPAAGRQAAAVGGAAMLMLLGVLTWRQAHIYSDEVTFFKHVIAHNPEAAGAHLNLAKALVDKNRMEEAEDAARIALAQRPDSYDAHVNLAVALSHQERFDEAERHLRRAIEIAPNESGPLQNLAVLLSRRNQMDEAEALLRRVLELDPRNLSTLRNLAALLKIQQQPEGALALYDRVVALGAGDVAVHTARGHLLRQLERFDEALAAWQRAMALGPQPNAAFALHLSMGRTEWTKSGAADAAAPHYERALGIDPRHAGTLSDLASLRIAQQRYEDAQALFQRAIEQSSNQAPWHAGRGYALYHLGRIDAAIESLERALALDPTLDQAHNHLALARAASEAAGG